MSSTVRKSMEPWIKDSVVYYPHQIKGIRTLARRTSFLLADDMGLGKSLQALTIFGIDVARGWASKSVVVCPTTLKGNWSDEIERFTGFSHLVLQGTPKQREKQLVQFDAIVGPKILIVNYEQVKPHLDALNARSFDVAIFDEAHYIKNHTSQRTKACLALMTKRTFLLTGTPMLNHVNELWALLHKIDPIQYPKYWSFVNRYCVFGGYKEKQIVGVKNEKDLTERLQSIMLRRLKKDVLSLSEPHIVERRVDLLPEQRRLYDEVKDEMKLSVAGEENPQDIDNALTKYLRLKQICGTTMAFTQEDHSAKLDLAIEDDLELLANGERVVVFTQFRDTLQCYIERISTHGVPVFSLHGDIPVPERQPLVKQWGMTKQPGVIVCMLQVAGVGLNMVQSSSASFIDKLYVPGLNRQAIDRLNRIGQTKPVIVREYIARNTVDNRINQILKTKSALSENIVESDNSDWKKRLLAALAKDDDD